MKFFDSHSHLNSENFDSDRNEIIQEIYNSGITKLVCAGYNLKQSIYALELAKENNFIYSSMRYISK